MLAQSSGLKEPPSLHPVIDPARCIGCGTCVQLCPEQPEHHVLGIIGGRAELVSPADCIGHGACRAACPVEAITLVFGTERRGIEIPLLTPRFETSVPGIFVAGELGGMGLIRNALEQGRQAVEAIHDSRAARRRRRSISSSSAPDPAGFAASLTAMSKRMRFVTLEQESLGGCVFQYPRGKLVMTAPATVPLVGKINLKQTSKEALLEFWREVERKTGLEIRYGERVDDIAAAAQGFVVRTPRAEYATRSVLLAIGRRGSPRKLEVPGEELPKVVYRLIEPEQYTGQQRARGRRRRQRARGGRQPGGDRQLEHRALLPRRGLRPRQAGQPGARPGGGADREAAGAVTLQGEADRCRLGRHGARGQGLRAAQRCGDRQRRRRPAVGFPAAHRHPRRDQIWHGLDRAWHAVAAGAALLLAAGESPAGAAATDSQPLAPVKAEISLHDFDAAAGALERLAATGNPEAEYLLGVFYLEGLDGPANPTLARQWLEKAAAHGEARAAFSLATLLAQATPPDTAGASRWLARARELGYRPRQTAVAHPPGPTSTGGAELTGQALWRAIERSDIPSARMLTERSAVTARDEFGRDALAYAAAAGRPNWVALLIRSGSAVGARDHYGITPLMLATNAGSLTAVEELLRAGAAVNVADDAGNTALMLAARRGNLELVQRLLAAHASVTARNVGGWSALDFALAADAAPCAGLLRAKGAPALAHGTVAQQAITSVQHPPPPHPDLYSRWPDIAVAATRNSPKLILAALQRGARADATTPDGTSVLTIAAQSGATDAVKALLTAGARDGGSHSRGAVALMAAIRARRTAVVAALLANGVSPDRQPGSVAAPLLVAVNAGNAAIIQALLAAHAQVDVQDESGMDALMLLSRRGDVGLAQAVLAAGGSTEIRDRAGRTALWYAARADQLPVVQLLIQHHARIDAADRMGSTPLAAACLADAVPMVAWLAGHGARIDARTRAGDTPLLLAAGLGHVDVVVKLLALHADKDARNALGDTALIVASRNGELAVVRQLMAAGADTNLRDRDHFTAADVAAARSFNDIVAQLRGS